MDRSDLEHMRAWADEKIAGGAEPPWAWYQYMKLRETLDAILDGMSATMQQTANTPGSGPKSRPRLREVDATYRSDSAPRLPAGKTIRTPM